MDKRSKVLLTFIVFKLVVLAIFVFTNLFVLLIASLATSPIFWAWYLELVPAWRKNV